MELHNYGLEIEKVGERIVGLSRFLVVGERVLNFSIDKLPERVLAHRVNHPPTPHPAVAAGSYLDLNKPIIDRLLEGNSGRRRSLFAFHLQELVL